MSQRVEAVLNASGLRGPALASLEGGSGLFALTDEHLMFHDSHGTRRVTLRDLARIHSDAEGTLRVETPAGVAMSASLIGFDGDAVQQFFGQVRDVTARIKSLTPPPLSPPPLTPAVPAASRPAPRPAPAPSVAPDPDQGVSVTAVRHPEPQKQRFAGPAPRITVNRGGQRAQLAAEPAGPRENGLGLGSAVGTGLGRNLPPPGSVEIRAVRTPTAAPQVPSVPPVPYEQDETAEREPLDKEQGHPAPATAPAPVPQPHQSQLHQSQPHQFQSPAPEPLHYTSRDLGTQAGRARGVPGRLRILAAVLVVGAVITALLMFLNAQRLLALWVLIAGVVGAIALLSVAELAQLQTIQAAVLAGPDAEAGDAAAPPTADVEEDGPPTPPSEPDPERHG